MLASSGEQIKKIYTIIGFVSFQALFPDTFSRMYLPSTYSKHWCMGASFGGNFLEKNNILFACTP